MKSLCPESYEYDASKAAGTGELLRAYAKGGRQFGVLHFALHIPIKSRLAGPASASVDAGSGATVSVDYDGCIDGQAAARTIESVITISTAEDATLVGGRKGKSVTTVLINCTRKVTEQAKK